MSVPNNNCTVLARLWKYAACRHARHLSHLQVRHVCLQPDVQDEYSMHLCIAYRAVLVSDLA